MTPNKKVKGIIIRDLKGNDNKMLESIREMFATKFNSVAVIKASYQCLSQCETIESSDREIRRLESLLEKRKAEFDQLQKMIRNYFNQLRENSNIQLKLENDLKKRVGVKVKKRTGLSALL